MCCRRNQSHQVPHAALSRCTAKRQERREHRALALHSLPVVEIETEPRKGTSQIHWAEYQPRTMAGILVMGVALGLQEGGKKIKEKRDERKAKKAALVSLGLGLQAYTDTKTGGRQLKCISPRSSLHLELWEAAPYEGTPGQRGRMRKPEESNSVAASALRDSTKRMHRQAMMK